MRMLMVFLVLILGAPAGHGGTLTTRAGTVRVERIIGGLVLPWAIGFLPGGGFLVTERGGRLLLVKGAQADRVSGVPKVYFTSFSTLLYLWPIMIVGWAGSWMVDWGLVGPSVMGWIWITVILLVLLCIGADTDRNKTIALVLVILLLWTSGLLLEAKKGIPVLSHIYDFFAAQDVKFEPGTAQVLSIATLIVLIFVVIGAWFDGRYEITTREISHRRLLRTSDSLPRAAKRIKRDWRDLTELILGIGAGDLIVLDSNKNIVMRISNVPFLWFFRHDVDHILEVLAVTDIDEAAAIEEDELG